MVPSAVCPKTCNSIMFDRCIGSVVLMADILYEIIDLLQHNAFQSKKYQQWCEVLISDSRYRQLFHFFRRIKQFGITANRYCIRKITELSEHSAYDWKTTESSSQNTGFYLKSNSTVLFKWLRLPLLKSINVQHLACHRKKINYYNCGPNKYLLSTNWRQNMSTLIMRLK